MAAYLSKAEFKGLTISPARYVDEIEADESGWTDRQLAYWSRWLDARLAKRYATPFAAPPNTPVAVTGWIERLVTSRVYLKRGIDPTDAQWDAIQQGHTDALAEIREAADSVEGLFELPLNESDTSDGITRGAPLSYTEASPYTWTTVQRDAAELEDQESG